MGVFLVNSTQSLARCRECSLAGWLSMQVPRTRQLPPWQTSSFASSSWFVRTRQWQYLDHRDNDKAKDQLVRKKRLLPRDNSDFNRSVRLLYSKQNFAALKERAQGNSWWHFLTLYLFSSLGPLSGTSGSLHQARFPTVHCQHCFLSFPLWFGSITDFKPMTYDFYSLFCSVNPQRGQLSVLLFKKKNKNKKTTTTSEKARDHCRLWSLCRDGSVVHLLMGLYIVLHKHTF